MAGSPGNLEVTIAKQARFVDPAKCTGCGTCLDVCPVRYEVQIPDEDSRSRAAFAQATDELVVTGIIANHRGKRGNLLPVLLDINRHFNWLPRPALEKVADELQTPLSEILRVASFYNAFSLVPRGQHIINVCLGTGCFVKGSPRLLESLERELGLKHGQTTEDMLFTLEVVRCIGCCALAPAMRVGDDTFGRVTPAMIPKILKSYAESYGSSDAEEEAAG